MTFQIDFMVATANMGYIVAIVDGRGTGFKGRKYRAAVSENLGYYEVLDQIAAARYTCSLANRI